MKKLLTMLVAACAATFAIADEEIAMVEKEITSITVPFGIRGYTPSNKDVVRVEKTSENALRITALKSGRCDLEVRGDMDMTQKFQISVGGDLPRTLATLRRELERMPEVHADIVGNRIRVDGEVKSIKKWNYLMKVLKAYPVRNFAEFTPGDELLIKMKENLQQCGLAVTFTPHSGKPESWKANEVALSYSKVNRTMNVQAKVYTPEQQTMIAECLARESAWIDINAGKNDAAAKTEDDFRVRLNTQVFVTKPIVRLSVAYMAIGESDLQHIGNSNATQGDGVLGLDGAFGVFREFIHGTTGNSRSQSIGATLDVTAGFLKKNGISRISDTGYTLIESWDKEGAKFKSGGTMFVKVAGNDVADLKEVPYGFEIKAKGGLVDEASMSCDFDFMVSTILSKDADTIDRQESLSKQKISMPIGRTTLIGGFKDLVDRNTPPSGLPILRNTPMLNWFVADSGKEVSDRRLVMLVCPEIVDNTQEAKPDVDKEINIRVQDQASKDTDEVIEERKPYSGFWSWLNWFTF